VKNHHDDLIHYRLERSRETFEEALLMEQASHWNACANRLYYACFYAILALLEKYGFASSKYVGVKSLFNKHFVKTGKISKDYGKLYNRLFDIRQEGDYMDFVSFEAEFIQLLVPKVKDFATVSHLVSNNEH